MGIENGTLNFDFTSFDYIRFGEGSRDLVIIPGLGDGLMTVRGKARLANLLLKDFTEDYRVTIISRKNELMDIESIESMAEDQYNAMRELGIEKAHIVGVSQGGMIAQYLAANYKDIVDKLVLVATVPKTNELLKDNVMNWMAMAYKGDSKAIINDINEKAHPTRVLSRMRPLYSVMAALSKVSDFRRFILQADACLNFDAEDILDKIDAETLIIAGKLDTTLGFEGSIILHEMIRNSAIFLYPDQGHALYEDAKDFNERILAFLS